jgi:hypothetical protein
MAASKESVCEEKRYEMELFNQINVQNVSKQHFLIISET